MDRDRAFLEGWRNRCTQRSLSHESKPCSFYTQNNAYITFLDKVAGSLEPGKLADFVVLDTDLLTCKPEGIKETKVEATYLGGKQVYP